MIGAEVVALVVVRDGELPAGADETTAECAGAVLLTGTGTGEAARSLTAARQVWCLELGGTGPHAVAAAVRPLLAEVPVVVLPASPDGRDLAPHLALAWDRPLLAGAVRCTREEAVLPRLDDRVELRAEFTGPVVVTLRTGVRGTPPPVPPPHPTDLTRSGAVDPGAGAPATRPAGGRGPPPPPRPGGPAPGLSTQVRGTFIRASRMKVPRTHHPSGGWTRRWWRCSARSRGAPSSPSRGGSWPPGPGRCRPVRTAGR
ncbi:hypothetical protein AB8O55_22550 [Saccharopolyspora cebuensis]|uniref:Uncharacterized protein n=1 Tax=Saccharopolyspora cebuensis TaxID=418759 RepID=A0ABV4CP41_9PSEU